MRCATLISHSETSHLISRPAGQEITERHHAPSYATAHTCNHLKSMHNHERNIKGKRCAMRVRKDGASHGSAHALPAMRRAHGSEQQVTQSLRADYSVTTCSLTHATPHTRHEHNNTTAQASVTSLTDPCLSRRLTISIPFTPLEEYRNFLLYTTGLLLPPIPKNPLPPRCAHHR
jgi:hypothetical protein